MRAGKHVEIEIPIADSFADAKQIHATQKATGKIAMAGHTRRFNPSHLWVANRIKKGELKLQQLVVQTYFFRRKNINLEGKPRSWTDHLLWHHACHTVDLFHYQTGEVPSVVHALQGPLHPELKIAMDMSIGMRTPSGVICNLSLSFNNDGPQGTFFRYICDNGTYIARYDDLFDGKDNKIDLSERRRVDERHRAPGSRVRRRDPREARAATRASRRCCPRWRRSTGWRRASMASIPVCMAPDPNTRVPKYRPPPGACDAHCHIFGPGDRYPYAPDRSYTPPDAPLERFIELQKTLGLSRAVLVNASCHGVDNTVILDAIAQSGGRYRGVANVDASFTDRDFTKLHDGGIRGIRFNFVQHLGGTPDMGEFKRARRARGCFRLARRAALRRQGSARVRFDAAHAARAVHHRSHGPRADEGRPRRRSRSRSC